MLLSEKTKLSVGFVLLVGGYVVSVENRMTVHTAIRQSQSQDLVEVKDLLKRVDRRLARIEGALKVSKKEGDKNDSE